MTTQTRNLADVLSSTAERLGDRVLLNRREGKTWRDVSAAAFHAEVAAVAKGLVAAGIEVGDRVGLMAKTRYEWTLVDFAIWCAGAVTVPVYETSAPEQIAWILRDSGARACVVETRGHSARLDSVIDRLPDLRATWVLESDGTRPTLDDLVASGRDIADDELAHRRTSMTEKTLATIIYTSGTTGRPKGCQLTHGNFLAECTGAVRMLPELFETPGASTLLFLPLAHVFGRMVQVACILSGTRLAHSDAGRLVKDLAATSPSFVLAVPQVFEKIYETARRKATADGKGKIFERATAVAIAYSTAREGHGPGPGLRLQHLLFDRLVYAKLRTIFGGRLEWAVSGGAPLGPRLGHFFRGMGVTVLEGYGLTETTAAATVNNRAGQRVGTVGRALPGMELRIGEGGEILVRGGQVFEAYWHDDTSTRSALDAETWLHTGDLGSLDDEGYLTITGRAKEILVTSGGKNVAPAGLEDAVRAHPLIAQCMVVGDQRPYVGALITLDDDALAAWQAGRDRVRPVAELVDDPDLRREVQKAVDSANAKVSEAESIRRFRVLPVGLTEAEGHLTPTQKLRREHVANAFDEDVQRLYAHHR